MIKKSDALASSSTFGLPVTRAVKIWRLSAVVCDHSDDFSVLTELHELGRLCALLVLVADHDAGQTTHHIQELKVQVRVQFQPALEIIAQRGASFDGSGWMIQDLGCNGRDQDNIHIVVRHYGVQIV